MKAIKALFLAFLTASTMTTAAYAADIFSIRTDLSPASVQNECAISVADGEVLEFSAGDLELRMGLAPDTLRGITVTALPPQHQGVLVLQGVEVDPYQFITRDELDELCFVPGGGAVAASLTLLSQGHDGVSTRLSINVLATGNAPPSVEGASFNTMKNTSLSGYLQATDPDGDSLTIKVIRQPAKGAVTVSGQTFTYTPFQGLTGSDSFTFCAVDRFSNFSAEATVDIKIENNRSGFYYVDMSGNPSEYAAVKLNEKGVYSGQKVGNGWFFYPDRQVNRGEFLLMLLAASGLDTSLSPTVNTNLENDSALPMWLKPYVKKAIDEGIWSTTQPFSYNEIPTRAEAVVMTSKAAKIVDVKEYDLRVTDAANIPAWALSAYKDLAAYRMLDLHDGNAYPAGALTNSYAADLIWQLYKHCEE